MTFRPMGAQRASSQSSMPLTGRRSKPAAQTPATEAHRRSPSRSFAVGLRIALAFAVGALVPIVMPAAPVDASCGTSWDSRVVPPETIRVYRTASRKVQVVDFKRYVQVVMASEWPSYLPRAAREVGATAVKQYAWYWTLEGKHRPWYVTPKGVCYDVTDTTVDQLYQPGSVTVDSRIRESVHRTWGLSLRKHGRFFLTGYRTGKDWRCGVDTDGWKVYARSVIACARKDKTRRQIQELYYNPNIAFVWMDDRPPPVDGDGIKPEVTRPRVQLRAASTVDGQVGRVTWSGSDASGIARFELQRSIDGGAWRGVALSVSKADQATVSLAAGRTHRFRVRARDKTGEWSAFQAGPTLRARLVESQDGTFQPGSWTVQKDRTASGGVTRFARSDGARASFAFTARGIAIVAPKAANRGRLRISIDGSVVATVDLFARELRPQRLVFSRSWATSGDHLIRVETIGDERVDVDAFLLLR